MKPKRSIYVVSADGETRKDIWELLTNNDMGVTTFEEGKDLLTSFQECPCDLAVLDLNLSNAEDCHIYSAIQDLDILPAIFLTDSQSDIDHVIACGGDRNNWFLKPFSKVSFMMQVSRIFKQQQQLEEDRSNRCLTLGDVVIDYKRKLITIQGIVKRLSPTEYNILDYLIKHYDQPIPRRELSEYIHNCEDGSEIHYSGESIGRLRRKLKTSELHIESIHGYGFRLKLKSPYKHQV